MSLREQILRDGYVVVPGMFTREELDAYRAALDDHFRDHGNIFKLGKTQPNAAMMVPAIAGIFHDGRVVAAFREVIGRPDIMFTGHCDVHKGMFSGWHKDTGPQHGYFTDDCFAGACDVYKMGVYLQDHSQGEGLTVIPGSHVDRHIVENGALPLKTKAGDVVIFDVRITHRGKTSDRIDKLLYRANQVVKIAAAKLGRRAVAKDDLGFAYRLRRLYDVATGRRHRHSIFFTYGAPDTLTTQFASTNLDRQALQNRSAGRLPEGLASGLQQEGVTLAPVLAAYT